jgi:hypothetical protein
MILLTFSAKILVRYEGVRIAALDEVTRHTTVKV